MKLFIEREEFKKLNVGFGLDEGMYVIFMYTCTVLQVWTNTHTHITHTHTGLANPTKKFIVYYNERTSCGEWIVKLKKKTALYITFMSHDLIAFKVVCQGNPGHGSRFIENTAGEKLVSESMIIIL